MSMGFIMLRLGGNTPVPPLDEVTLDTSHIFYIFLGAAAAVFEVGVVESIMAHQPR